MSEDKSEHVNNNLVWFILNVIDHLLACVAEFFEGQRWKIGFLVSLLISSAELVL